MHREEVYDYKIKKKCKDWDNQLWKQNTLTNNTFITMFVFLTKKNYI